jgi:hypothetical protein
MDVSSLKKGVSAGTITIEQVLELLLQQIEVNRRLTARVEMLEARLARYEPPPPKDVSGSGTPTDYSVAADEQRRRGRRKKQKSVRRGRLPTEDKLAEATRFEDVFPAQAKPRECVLARTRVAWRIIDGRAVRVAYRVHRRTHRSDAPAVPGLLPRGEYGLEIVVLVAFLVYVVRVSLDQACALLQFFCGLPIEKSQADTLLNQLARHWQQDFDALCELVTLAAVVYLDETSWKIDTESCSLWALQSPRHTVLKFGCRKDDATLDQLLPPDVFAGIAVSDDAAVYRGRFAQAQKCWAHLLRKAIQLTLLYPEKRHYQTFLDDLLTVYREAKSAQQDGRLSAAGRERQVARLETRIWDVAAPHQQIWESPRTPDERDFANLVQELFRLVATNELFTFVRHPEVEPTNNVSERELRGPALCRKTGRTNKTPQGAHRQSVISSVLRSLQKHLPAFTLSDVVTEVLTWRKRGLNLFRHQLAQAKTLLAQPPPTLTPCG